MQFKWDVDPDTKLPHLVWRPGEYDAIVAPDRLVFDKAPNTVSPDRCAVACTFLLRGFLEGPVEFPDSISPLTALSVERYLHPAKVNPTGIDATPRQLPRGTARLIVKSGFPSPVVHGAADPRQLQLIPLRSDEHSGALFGIDHLYVISNYYMFVRPKVDELETLIDDARLRLALGVLFAEDAGADVLVLESAITPPIDWTSRHRELLGAVNLGLEVVGTGIVANSSN